MAARFTGDAMISARSFGVAPTPWRALQRAAWADAGSDFVDVATLGTAILANFGRCRVEGER